MLFLFVTLYSNRVLNVLRYLLCCDMGCGLSTFNEVFFDLIDLIIMHSDTVLSIKQDKRA